ncbi:carbohydrate kinase [Cognatishimia sp. WU-CL00825]|uniref:carbohydrate kinase family protein n=1 Tax=Cognatishimia sp. WU-CL00825 TaxID=3127658 RepID=UPI0031038874
MILCCGEALIDMIPSTSLEGQDGFVPHAGGSVFNTAIALGRLGVSTGMLAGVSRDLFGQLLVSRLHESHVDTSFVVTSDRPTTLAFVHLADGHATYTFFDENSAGRMVTAIDFPAVPPGVDALYFGGISLAVEPAADAFVQLMAAQSNQRAIIVDPNIRPAFIQDHARYRARLAMIFKYADIVKVSDEDLDWIYQEPLSQKEKAHMILDQGVSLVILTRGKSGAKGFLANGDEVIAPAHLVDVVDTVGAGDTFNAGVLANLAQSSMLTKSGIHRLSVTDVQSALHYGAKIAAVTVSRAGANPPWLEDL